jgi:hypothetical protein
LLDIVAEHIVTHVAATKPAETPGISDRDRQLRRGFTAHGCLQQGMIDLQSVY